MVAPLIDPAAGKLLVATPALDDPNFAHSVVLLLAVETDGVFGVVLNRPSDRRVEEVLPAWDGVAVPPAVIFLGGPVGLDSVVGLSELGVVDLGQLENGQLEASGIRLFAGSAGWGPGQLQAEIAQGAWWVFDPMPGDVTYRDPDALWSRVLSRQGGRTAWFALATSDPSFN